MLIHISYLCQMGGSTTQLAYPSPQKNEGATSSKQFSWGCTIKASFRTRGAFEWWDVGGREVWTSIEDFSGKDLMIVCDWLN